MTKHIELNERLHSPVFPVIPIDVREHAKDLASRRAGMLKPDATRRIDIDVSTQLAVYEWC